MMVSVDNCIFLCCFLLMFVAIPLRIHKSEYMEFDHYLKSFNKSYETKEEYIRHLESYKDNLVSINNFNTLRNNNHSAIYGLTTHTDLSSSDFHQKYLILSLLKNNKDQLFVGNPQMKSITVNGTLHLPLRVDWRNYSVITDVNDQKYCGGCWAFTVIENVEAMYALKYGNLTRFSVQQMIDCAMYNSGCHGGDMCRLLRWLLQYDIPIRNVKEYPLTLHDGNCKLNRSADGVRISDFVCRNYAHDETKILSLLANHGPVIAAINALTWQNYLGGVIQYHCGGSGKLLNHAVQIVGYDLSADIPHYIVRNSWGKDFGDDGYLYISIGNNTCGIANEVIALNVK